MIVLLLLLRTGKIPFLMDHGRKRKHTTHTQTHTPNTVQTSDLWPLGRICELFTFCALLFRMEMGGSNYDCPSWAKSES